MSNQRRLRVRSACVPVPGVLVVAPERPRVPGPVPPVEHDRVPVGVYGHPRHLPQPVQGLLRRPFGHRVEVDVAGEVLALANVWGRREKEKVEWWEKVSAHI